MLDLRRPTPYEKRGDQIIPLQPHHYLTMFNGVEQRDADGKIITVNGRIMYATQRVYVAEGSVYEDEERRVPQAEIETRHPWFWDAYRKLSPEIRRTAGLALPEEHVGQASDLPDSFLTTWETLPAEIREQLSRDYVPEVQEVKMWTCDLCQAEIPLKTKGVHIGRNHAKGKQ